jgi:hypothetical protein
MANEVVVGQGVVPIRGDFTQLHAGAAVESKAAAATVEKSFAATFTKIAKAGTLAFGALAVGGGAALLKLGDSFDAQYDKIRTTTGKTGKELETLQGNFRNVLKNVPVSFDQAGDAIAGMSQRLNLTGRPLEAMSERAAVLNRIIGGDMKTQIEGATRVMGDWGVETNKMPGVLDKLFRASQATGIPIEALQEKLVKFGAPLRQLGFSFDSSAALLGKFEKEGVNTDLVMGSMRIALGKMAKAGEPAQATFKRVTESIKNAGSTSEANQKALELFGAKAGPDMAAAIREGRFEIDSLTEHIANGGDNILQAGRDTEDFAEKFQRLKNRLAVAFEPAAMKAFDLLGASMDWISGTVGPKVVEVFGNLRDDLAPLGDVLGRVREAAGFLFENFRLGTLSAETFGEIMTLVFGPRSQVYFEALGRGVGLLVDGFQKLAGLVDGALGKAFEFLTETAGKFFNLLDEHKELFAIVAAGILHFLIPAVIAMLTPVAAATAGWLSMAAAVILANLPLIAISLAIGAVVAGLLYAYNHFEGFRNVVDTVARTIRDVAIKAFEGLVILWEQYLLPAIQKVAHFFSDVLWPAVQTAWDLILAAISFAWNSVIKPIFDIISWYVENVLIRAFNVWKFVVVDLVIPLIMAAVKELWEIVRPIFDFIRNAVEFVLVGAFNILAWVAGIVWTGISNAVKSAWSIIEPIFEAVRSFVADKLTPVWDALVSAARTAWDALPGLIQGALRVIGGIIGGFLDGVGSIADAIGLDHIADVLKNGAKSARSWGQGPGATTQGSGNIAVQGGIRRREGGYVPGPNVMRDIVPALLTPHEWVMRPEAVQKYGIAFMSAVNEGRFQFRLGGLVPDIDLPGLADGVIDTVRGLGTRALEKVWPHLNDRTGHAFGLSFPGGDVPAGGANFIRQAVFDKIRGEEAKMAVLSGGGFTRQGGGGPAGRYTPGMERARAAILNLFGPMSVGGYANRNIAGTGQKSMHALWRAFDFMTGKNVARGNAVSNYLIQHAGEFGLKGLIWNAQKNFGAGWGPYRHPGGGTSDTLMHRDHVHAEFFRRGGLVPPGYLENGWQAARAGMVDTAAAQRTRTGPMIENFYANDREAVDEFYRRARFHDQIGVA